MSVKLLELAVRWLLASIIPLGGLLSGGGALLLASAAEGDNDHNQYGKLPVLHFYLPFKKTHVMQE